MNGYPPPLAYPPIMRPPLVTQPPPFHPFAPPAMSGYMPYPMAGIPGMPMAPYPSMSGMPMPMPMPQVMAPAPITTGTIVKPPAAPSPQAQKQTTVYVGKIAPTVEDDFLQSLLQQCGPVASWKRVTDPINNQARAFGFCTYESAEGVLRAIRLLNDFELDERKLLVKVDDNTKRYLEEYERGKKMLEDKARSQLGGDIDMEGKEPSSEELDEQVRTKLKNLVAERTAGVFFDKYFQADGNDKVVIPVAEGEVVAGHEIDRHGLLVVAQEIKNFRVRQAKRDQEKKERGDDDGRPGRDRESEREQRERERERARVREQRARDREREARRRDREKREFREREREWVGREKEKERERERREREDERERERQVERELKYDEEEDRQLRKAGRRKRAREREEEEDQEDRKAEEEEARLAQEREEELIRRKQEEEERLRLEEEERIREEEARKQPLRRIDIFLDDISERTEMQPFISFSQSIDQRISQAKKLGFGFASDTQKRPRIVPGFNPDEEPNPLLVPKKKKLIPLDPMKSEEQIKKEREEEAKAIVKLIPTGKDELFTFSMDWDTIDNAGIVSKRMKPWVTKKIVEYLGEEEPTLIDFVVNKMGDHMAPQEILGQLTFVLEDEAEVFVIKLWRMLIFEMIRAQRETEKEKSTED